ncbi:MAG: hypothetical protein WC346_17830 [Methanogenium sp.]
MAEKTRQSFIYVGETAKIVARLENSGEPVTGTINMSESTGCGRLTWSSRETGTVLVEKEKTEVINDISGVSQCVLAVKPVSVVGVWVADSDGNATGNNLYLTGTADLGRTVDLNLRLTTGTELVVTYYKSGSVENEITGVKAGKAQVTVSAAVNTEKGLSEIVEIEVKDRETTTTTTRTTDTTSTTTTKQETTRTTTTTKTVPVTTKTTSTTTTKDPMCTIEVETSPSGAKIYCNFQLKGNSPISWKVYPGSATMYAVKAVMSGYDTFEWETFRLTTAGENKYLEADLQAKTTTTLATTYSVQGPTQFKKDVSNALATYGYWNLRSSNSLDICSGHSVKVVQGNGYIQPKQVSGRAALEIAWAAFGQTITIEVSANVTTQGVSGSTRVESAQLNVVLHNYF